MSLFSISDLSAPPEDKTSDDNQEILAHGSTKAGHRRNRCVGRRSINKPVLDDVVGDLRSGDSMHLVGSGLWNQHDLIEYFQKKIGPCRAYICTWAVSVEVVAKIADMRSSGKLTGLWVLVDPRTTTQKTDACAVLANVATGMGVHKNHAKVYVLRSDDAGISIVTSANMTKNSIMEAGVIAHSEEVADFHIDWIMRGIAGSPPFDAGAFTEETKNDGVRRRKNRKDAGRRG